MGSDGGHIEMLGGFAGFGLNRDLHRWYEELLSALMGLPEKARKERSD